METKQNHLTIPIIKIPQGRLGMWILIAGELVIFGGLICFYLLNRIRYPHWGQMAAHTNTFIGALNTVVLLLSSYTVVRAHGAALKMDVAKVRLWLSCTLLGGVLFLVDKSIEYAHEISEGFTFTSPKLVAAGDHVGSLFWSYYYIMTGLHGVHVLAGMTVMLIIMIQTRKGKNLHRVELAGMYWHMVDLIWIFLFPLLYIAK
ncbi:MAG TPA: cytochrome c oxidase subunit 3 [Bacteroidia bacterium]|nr:cytochrome c oxidase subunit 3 [Bacteroidia bacterium]